MSNLVVVSLIWAFSFGLVKNTLAGVDPFFITFARLAVSFFVFLPFLRLRGLSRNLAFRLVLVGALQFGLMYLAYTYSFKLLEAYEVALFTIFTPLYVTLIHDALHRRLNLLHLAAAALAVVGTAVVKQGEFQPGVLAGFWIVQLSNLGFAFGQVYYRHILRSEPGMVDRRIFALPYLGGALVTGVTAAVFTPWGSLELSSLQAGTLLYLGAVASGLSFFLWNAGSRRVDAGTLAIFNNLKIPLAVAVSLLFFGEQASLPHLLAGGTVVMASLALNQAGERHASLRARTA